MSCYSLWFQQVSGANGEPGNTGAEGMTTTDTEKNISTATDTTTRDDRATASVPPARTPVERQVVYVEAQKKPGAGLGIAAFILAVVGLVLALMPPAGPFVLALGVLAVSLGLAQGYRSWRKGAPGKAWTVLGVVLGIGAIAAGIADITIVMNAVDGITTELNNMP